jgi:hypothetical protein
MENIQNNYSAPPDVRLLNKLGAKIDYTVVNSKKYIDN